MDIYKYIQEEDRLKKPMNEKKFYKPDLSGETFLLATEAKDGITMLKSDLRKNKPAFKQCEKILKDIDKLMNMMGE